jgi:hypothetical protein
MAHSRQGELQTLAQAVRAAASECDANGEPVLCNFSENTMDDVLQLLTSLAAIRKHVASLQQQVRATGVLLCPSARCCVIAPV